MTTNSTHESSEGNDFLLGNHILQVDSGPVEGHLLDGLSCLPGVLEHDWAKSAQCPGGLRMRHSGILSQPPFNSSKFNPLLFSQVLLRESIGSCQSLVMKEFTMFYSFIFCISYLEMNPKVGAFGLGSLSGVVRFGGVTSHI